jgi:isochorismate synthase
MRPALCVPDLQAVMCEAASRLCEAASRPDGERLVSVRAEGPDLDLLDILATPPPTGIGLWYWRSPDGQEIAAFGHAWEQKSGGSGRVQALRRAWAQIATSASIALCGLAFDPQGPHDPAWVGFPSAVLVVPRMLLRRSGHKTQLVLTVRRDEDPRAVMRDLAGIVGKGPQDGAMPAEAASPPRLTPTPPVDRWKALVDEAVRAIRGGALRKVVLARSVHVVGGTMDPLSALRRLRDRYPECTVFGVRRKERWFIGATPERLGRVSGRTVEVAVLAGTAPRVQDPEEDAALGIALLHSPKERLEHRIASEFVASALRPMCDAIRVEGPFVVRMRNVQHLETRVRGVFREPVTILDLLDRLHPTPAVAGLPLPEALRWIEREGIDRGWYAGLLGWLGGFEEGEFVVGIRSAVIGPCDAVAFAGCGIVADSDPEQELAESHLKLRPILEALGLDPEVWEA